MQSEALGEKAQALMSRRGVGLLSGRGRACERGVGLFVALLIGDRTRRARPAPTPEAPAFLLL